MQKELERLRTSNFQQKETSINNSTQALRDLRKIIEALNREEDVTRKLKGEIEKFKGGTGTQQNENTTSLDTIKKYRKTCWTGNWQKDWGTPSMQESTQRAEWKP